MEAFLLFFACTVLAPLTMPLFFALTMGALEDSRKPAFTDKEKLKKADAAKGAMMMGPCFLISLLCTIIWGAVLWFKYQIRTPIYGALVAYIAIFGTFFLRRVFSKKKAVPVKDKQIIC